MDFFMPWGALVKDGDTTTDLDLSIRVRVTHVIGDDAPDIEFLETRAINAETGALMSLSHEIEQDLIACPKLHAAILIHAAERRQYERDEAADHRREMMREAASG